MKNEFNANRSMTATANKGRQLMAERKPLDFNNKPTKAGDKNNSATWELV